MPIRFANKFELPHTIWDWKPDFVFMVADPIERGIAHKIIPDVQAQCCVFFDDVLGEEEGTRPPTINHLTYFFRYLEENQVTLDHKCLFTCPAALSRSPALAVAFLMYHNKPPKEALAIVKELRPLAIPNARVVRLAMRHFKYPILRSVTNGSVATERDGNRAA